MDGIKIQRRHLLDERLDYSARPLPFSQKGFPANDDDGEAIWRQRLVEMLADSGGLVGFRQIFAGIAHLLDDPGDIGIAIAVMMIGCLAQEIRRGRHARSCADAHIEAAIKKELLDFWAGAIDADRRSVVVSGGRKGPRRNSSPR